MAEYNPILSAPQGANKKPKRVGRGSSSGLGTTAGKGNKGQQSRSGGKTYVGFEGGQMPLYRRIARKGFSNYPFKKEYAVINLSDLNVFENGTVVTPALLKERGIVKKQLSGIKVLGEGQLEKKLTVQAHKFSKSAIDKINESGSKAEVI